MRYTTQPNTPQTFPSGWEETFTASSPTPTEKQLIQTPSMSDEDYEHFRLDIDTRALVYTAMHAFDMPAIPDIANSSSGSFHRIFCITFHHPTSEGLEFNVTAWVPLPHARIPGRVETTVAMMSFACHLRGIPTPEIYAWNAETGNLVGALYILMEWAEGTAPWLLWEDYTKTEKVQFLGELANHHGKFAEPIHTFEGFGSIYFAKEDDAHHHSLQDIGAYRLGPFIPGPIATHSRGISKWPQSTSPSLRGFWIQLWEHEVKCITDVHGVERSAIVPEKGGQTLGDPATISEFLDVAAALRVLIDNCALPDPEQHPSLYAPCLVPTDYAFRNMLIDRETHKVSQFLDWDDAYVLPFFLCSYYPEDICHTDGVGSDGWDTGCFRFLPLNEEGDVPDEESPSPVTKNVPDLSADKMGNPEDEAKEHDADSEEDEDSFVEAEEDGNESEPESAEEPSEDNESVNPSTNAEDKENEEDHRQRVRDTRLRRGYERLLAEHDPRFASDGFWTKREDPMKINHLVMQGFDFIHPRFRLPCQTPRLFTDFAKYPLVICPSTSTPVVFAAEHPSAAAVHEEVVTW
ncbi:hypothetical protein NLJ89_g8602 [Agrocybe chaxingu]|uniref:Altered inheritance of mitochondria protein 9, mitochondrial n=1 Tax=Agrocybe chaxingu TaxID=84603 RepID=A0A9W8MSL6_9AGAR|nr:hypothetical protein NLJ89_g8602 [Agrocybe chaxingu]